MSKNLDKLKGHSEIKHDIDRRNGEVKGKESLRLSKRLDDLKRVISDPDVWNANIASRDRMDDVEHRVSGISYLVKRLVMNKRIQESQLEVLEENKPISGSHD